MQMKKKGLAICIPSIDGKDLYAASKHGTGKGYTLRYASGDFNYKKFVNTIPYSMDLIKLREVYEKVYRRLDFSFVHGEREYTTHVINVTFNYSNKTFNKLGKGLFLRFGYEAKGITLDDNVCVKDGVLVAIKINEPVEHPVSDDLLGGYFKYDDGKYKVAKNDTITSIWSIREAIYNEGFDCDGVHYVRFKRSSGSSRVGKCLFIDEKLYRRMAKWDMCGLNIKQGTKMDLAAYEAYISLTSSSIIDTLEIQPENILLIDDYTSTFTDRVAATFNDKKNELHTEIKDVEVSNSIWDGQSLMQTELFKGYRNYGFVLLRNRFFKSAAFNCDIQKFFVDNGITEISQLKGKTIATDIKDIKLITTPSSIKYLKFGTFEQWLMNIEPEFGLVKHEKPTHYFDGRMVKTHYQLLNTLHMSYKDVEEFLQPSLDYATLLKTEPAIVRNHIKYPAECELSREDVMAKNDVVYKLMGLNDDIAKTQIYYDFKTDLVKSYIKDIKKGRVFVNGNYSVLCGNPIEMLRASIGKFDGTSQIGVGNIHNVRFKYDSEILGSRSPHVTISNILITTNRENAEIDRYFTCTDEIVYVNAINENLLERLSGCD